MSLLGTHAQSIFEEKYQFNAGETWEGCSHRVASWLFPHQGIGDRLEHALRHRKIMAGGRYYYAAGRGKPQINNCFLFNCEDSAEGWAELGKMAALASMKGGGVGAWYGDVRPEGTPISGYGGKSSGPMSVMHAVNDAGRRWKEGASRRSANWAGLPWDHEDIRTFIHAKEWIPEVRALKAKDYNFPADLDQTNISVGIDDKFFAAINAGDVEAWGLFIEIVEAARHFGDPGFSIDCGPNSGEHLRNPCTEVTSRDDADVCNLGSLNFARISNLNDLEYHARLVTRMLYEGTFRSFMPFEKCVKVREQNRRIGVGILGIHEWCLQRELPYAPTRELQNWLEVYEGVVNEECMKVAAEKGTPVPIKNRAIAPTGTIGMLAETTMGVEAMFAVAQKRRWQDEGKWKYRVMVNPVADRLIRERGIDPDNIEDTYSLDLEQRLEMQAFVQRYVDQGISSTVNLPAFGKPGNDDTEKMAGSLLKYLPELRGVTVYPDGAHSGQPMEKISYEEAIAAGDDIVLEDVDICDIRAGGTCGA